MRRSALGPLLGPRNDAFRKRGLPSTIADAEPVRPGVRRPDLSQPAPGSARSSENPEAVSPRVFLEEAAAATNQNELAMSAITPLLERDMTLAMQPETQESEGAEEASGPPEYPDALWKSFLRGQELSDGQKSLLATQLAGALVKLDRLEEAARFWKIAAMLATGDSARAQASRELERVQARLKLAKADQERRPVITNRLEQTGLIRPRLISQSGPSAGGGK